MHRTNILELVKPRIELKEQALAYRAEHFACGERIINGSELFDQIDCYEEWMEKVIKNTERDTVAADWVLTDTYFACRKTDQKIVGMIDLRYELNDFLKDFGNCGYSVRPSERRKGYATEMLFHICNIARRAGLDKLQLSVEKENISSIKTIVQNGGKYERSITFNNEEADIYQIQL
ncbi:GNAT family N-acetyltransferase [Anaeromicropila populeti]|uniref:Predicted acetyltransferase n=1 Tax=Anaeromicropila populeti TaxID=37658 RepID=A0A1I6IG02_9FIRM|nr:GNAT family N-acetyltransferase [Anaeromicropila populeti]SFR65250.1 Predicted acetyltransferase [Anaeromicropila populeti]